MPQHVVCLPTTDSFMEAVGRLQHSRPHTERFKLQLTLKVFKRNVRTKHQSVKELAYITLVRPQVEYASKVWCPYTKKNIQQIEMVQSMAACCRAARWVSNNYSPYDGVSAMLSDMGWRFLEYQRYDARLAMAFKIYHGIVAVPMPSYFEHPRRFTRHMHQLSFRQVDCFF